VKFAYAVTKWNGSMLDQTLHSIPPSSRVLVVNNKANNWPLSRGWNYAIDQLLWREGFDAAIVMNDDVVLRPDTGDLLAGALLRTPAFVDWTGRELLLISARHAAPSDACTDVPDWDLLRAANPVLQPGPDFACFCVGRKLFERVGRFDEEFEAFFEDNDMHRRIQLAGFEAGAYAPYWHFRNGTIRTDERRAQEVRNGLFERSKRRYCEKWGVPYDQQNPIGRETFYQPFAADGGTS
jgi:hypothetical protein